MLTAKTQYRGTLAAAKAKARKYTCDSGKEKAHKHKQFFPVIARVGGGLPTGWPGVKRLCAVCGT